MAIDVRTPEDLNKVFEDIFSLLYSINHRISNIEAEIHKMRLPTTLGPGSITWEDDNNDMTKEIQDIIKAFKNDKKARE